jgi:hypothetical protein
MSGTKNNNVLCNWCRKELGKYEKYVLFRALSTEKTIRVGGILLCEYCADAVVCNIPYSD